MIDRSMIDTKKLLDIILDDFGGNINSWWRLVELVEDYVPPFSQPNTKPMKCVIRCGRSFLRDLGRGVYIWDLYGDDFFSPEAALLSLMEAPVPPYLLKWNLIHEKK